MATTSVDLADAIDVPAMTVVADVDGDPRSARASEPTRPVLQSTSWRRDRRPRRPSGKLVI
jgi:hypothetical protein